MTKLDRRSFVRAAAGGFLGALAAQWLRSAEASAGDAAKVNAKAKAKACIVLWLNGGPSHIDTFDPKPGTATGGSFKSIKTRAPAIQLSEHFPELADKADKIAVLRGMTSREGNHQRAQYLLHTGYAPTPTVVHPALGAWTACELGKSGADLPAFVSLGGPSAGGGVLGVQYGPFVVPKIGQLPMNVAPPEEVDAARFAQRRSSLDWMEERFAATTGDPKVAERRAVYAEAVRLMASPRLSSFDPSQEPAALRQAYGDTDFGRGCITARRLVEAGVPFVEVVLDGWDTHRDNFTRVASQCKTLDPAIATLLSDLDHRGLLAHTVVACLGEFGRTPRINGNDGRDHYPQAWSAVLAGAGLRRGVVHGQTDAEGGKVVSGATTVPDLFATLATLLGMSPTTTIESPSGRPIALTDGGHPLAALLA